MIDVNSFGQFLSMMPKEYFNLIFYSCFSLIALLFLYMFDMFTFNFGSLVLAVMISFAKGDPVFLILLFFSIVLINILIKLFLVDLDNSVGLFFKLRGWD